MSVTTCLNLTTKPKALRHMTAAWSRKHECWSYYFNVRKSDADAGCPVASAPLGNDREAAQQVVDTKLWPQFQAWKKGVPSVSERNAEGSLHWLIGEYVSSRFFLGEEGAPGAAPVVVGPDGVKSRLLSQERKNKIWHLNLIADHEMLDGRRVGELPLTSITPALRERLLEALLWVPKWSKKKKRWVLKRRLKTRNQAFRYVRSMWNAMKPLHPAYFPDILPFAEMRLKDEYSDFPAASFDQLQLFIAKADEMGFASVGTAALVGWEWMQRRKSILLHLSVNDYAPEYASDFAFVEHAKTDEHAWVPLYDADGTPLFEQLAERLKRAKGNRHDGPLIYQDDVFRLTGEYVSWASADGSARRFSKIVRKIMVAAGLVLDADRDDDDGERDLSFSSFRHGALTELGEAELSEVQIVHFSRHKSARVMHRYPKRSARLIADSQIKRLSSRHARPPGEDPILSRSLQRPKRNQVKK